MTEKSPDQIVEELSEKLGGRFKLTALVQKQVRNYYVTGRTFMPNVKNLHELFLLVLDQVENDEIALSLPGEETPQLKQLGGSEAESAEEKPELESDEAEEADEADEADEAEEEGESE